jgi:hypothetical protein
MTCTCPSYTFPHREGSGTCVLGAHPSQNQLVEAHQTVQLDGDQCGSCYYRTVEYGFPDCKASPGTCIRLSKHFTRRTRDEAPR